MTGWEWFLLVIDKNGVLEWMDGSGFLLVLDKSEVLECLDGSGISL